MKYGWLFILLLTVINLALMFYQIYKSSHKPDSNILGTILFTDNGSMYVEMMNEEAIKQLQDSDFATFIVLHEKTQK